MLRGSCQDLTEVSLWCVRLALCVCVSMHRPRGGHISHLVCVSMQRLGKSMHACMLPSLPFHARGHTRVNHCLVCSREISPCGGGPACRLQQPAWLSSETPTREERPRSQGSATASIQRASLATGGVAEAIRECSA